MQSMAVFCAVHYNLEPETDDAHADDWQAAVHTSSMYLSRGKAYLEPCDVPEVWAIFLCKGDPSGKRKLLYHQSIGENPNGSKIVHYAYLSCSIARELAGDPASWQKPRDGMGVEQWCDLLRWGLDLSAENPDDIQTEDLKDRMVQLESFLLTED